MRQYIAELLKIYRKYRKIFNINTFKEKYFRAEWKRNCSNNSSIVGFSSIKEINDRKLPHSYGWYGVN